MAVWCELLQVNGRMHGRGMNPDFSVEQDQYRGPRPMYPSMGMGMGMPMGMGMANPMGMGPMHVPTMAMGPMGMPMPLIPGPCPCLHCCTCLTALVLQSTCICFCTDMVVKVQTTSCCFYSYKDCCRNFHLFKVKI